MVGATDCVHQLLKLKGDHVETTKPDTPVRVAVMHMNECHVGSLLVVDDDSVVGILTERDVLARVVAAGRDPGRTVVGEVMTPELVVIDPSVTVADAMGIVTNRRCRHLPVLDKGRLCGLVSAGDLAAWLVREQQRTIYDLHDYITR